MGQMMNPDNKLVSTDIILQDRVTAVKNNDKSHRITGCKIEFLTITYNIHCYLFPAHSVVLGRVESVNGINCIQSLPKLLEP